MSIYKQLNEVIEYLEKNVMEKIDYKKAAKILGTNLYTTEQLFKLLTGITMKEYVRLRKLTLAAKDLREQRKVIDVALTYGYSNPASFTRSFTNFHHITPRQAKQNKKTKVFPVIHFNEDSPNITNMDYKIVLKRKFTIYTRKEKFSVKNNSTPIEKYWEKTKKEIEQLKKAEMRYGISENIPNEKNNFIYHIGLDSIWPKSSKKTFSANSWFVISSKSYKAQDIHNIIEDAKSIYLPSLNYKLKEHNYIEIYHKNTVELWFPLT